NARDMKAFGQYYAETIGQDQGSLFKNLQDDSINASNTSAYVNIMVAKYSTFYDQYKSLSPSDRALFNKPAGTIDPPWPGACGAGCNNTNFENGTLSGWMACYSNNTSTSAGGFSYATPTCSGILSAVTTAATYPTTGLPQVTITSAASGADPVCAAAGIPFYLPQLCNFNGNFSVMVGDGPNPNYGVGILEQAFTVSSSNCDFTYYYAVVLEVPNPPHTYIEQPYFRVNIYDQSGNIIPTSGNLLIVADSAKKQGLKAVYYPTNNDTCYIKPWTMMSVSLKKYIGQCVTVKVVTADCSLGGHFGYGYFDAQCGPFGITTSSPTICNTPINLTSPSGTSYAWTGPCIIGAPNTQTISIGCAGKYTVIVKSGTVADTLDTVIVSGAGTTVFPDFKADTVCPGSPTHFTNLTSGTGITYAWDFGDPASGAHDTTSIVNPTHTYTGTGNYVVTLNALHGACGHDTTIHVLVRSLPTITITSLPASDTVCSGSPITLSGNGGVSYSWSGGITNGTPFNLNISGKYIVTGTDAHGCSNKDSVHVVASKPVITIVSSPANDSVCKGASITLSGSGGVSYSWSGGITNATPFVPPASGKYVIIGTNSKGCSSKDSVIVTVDVPNIIIASSPVNDTVCNGGKITLTASGAYYYSWTGGIFNGNAFSPSSSGKYVVTGTDDNGCVSKDSVNVIAGSGALPTITSTSSPSSDTICIGNTITLTASGGSYYNWSGGASNGVPFSPTKSGKYIVTGTNSAGCSNNDTVNV
ncbi:MAG TPA: PKD domain-containing protein, partial [Bacteroidia bacterium]|nr:PKD domain-containing protein [Bacteroidia bacterium]